MAWIKTIPRDQAEGLLKAEYDNAAANSGRSFGLAAIQSLNPALLQRSLELYSEIMKGPSSLSRIEREMIAVVISVILKAPFLVEAHAENLRELTQDDRLVRLMKIDYRMLLLEDRARAILDFAVRVTKETEASNPEALQDLRDKGLTDEDILNTVEVVGFFNYLSRLANALGLENDSTPTRESRMAGSTKI